MRVTGIPLDAEYVLVAHLHVDGVKPFPLVLELVAVGARWLRALLTLLFGISATNHTYQISDVWL